MSGASRCHAALQGQEHPAPICQQQRLTANPAVLLPSGAHGRVSPSLLEPPQGRAVACGKLAASQGQHLHHQHSPVLLLLTVQHGLINIINSKLLQRARPAVCEAAGAGLAVLWRSGRAAAWALLLLAWGMIYGTANHV